MPIEIKVESNLAGVIANMRRVRANIIAGLRKGLNDENWKTIRALTLGRMGYSSAGPVMPGGLRRISSTAVRSLRATPAVTDSDGVTSSLGSHLKYVQAHEFGCDDVVTVPAHNRRVFNYGKARQVRFTNPVTKESQTTMRRSRKVAKDAGGNARGTTVREHPMQMNLPARHMIRDTLAERVPEYAATMAAAIETVWNDFRAVSARAPVQPGGLAP